MGEKSTHLTLKSAVFNASSSDLVSPSIYKYTSLHDHSISNTDSTSPSGHQDSVWIGKQTTTWIEAYSIRYGRIGYFATKGMSCTSPVNSTGSCQDNQQDNQTVIRNSHFKTLLIYRPFPTSVHKTSPYANTKHNIHKHQTQSFKELVSSVLPLLTRHV